MNRYNNFKKWWLIPIIGLMLTIFFNPIVNADIGPKPSLDLIVRGIDTDEYWLDLLVTDDARYSFLEITDEERNMISKLAEYQDDEGFHPALLVGTIVPLHGKLKGEKQSDGTFFHKFSYLGVPEVFKIAILKQDGTLIVSDIVNRKQFQSVMIYDLNNLKITEKIAEPEEVVISAGEVSEKIPWINILTGFVIRLISTLLIEILIALMLGFIAKQSLKVILITNTATQFILNVLILFSHSMDGLFSAVLTFIIVEIFIIIAELIVYLKYLTEKSALRRIIYAILANLVSIAVGLMLFVIT